MIKPLLVATICAAICGCAQVDDDRIPAMPVSINPVSYTHLTLPTIGG